VLLRMLRSAHIICQVRSCSSGATHHHQRTAAHPTSPSHHRHETTIATASLTHRATQPCRLHTALRNPATLWSAFAPFVHLRLAPSWSTFALLLPGSWPSLLPAPSPFCWLGGGGAACLVRGVLSLLLRAVVRHHPCCRACSAPHTCTCQVRSCNSGASPSHHRYETTIATASKPLEPPFPHPDIEGPNCDIRP
jgi:hypothetical protein